MFGGSGFLGRHVVRALAYRGYRIRVAVRRPELAGFLRPMGRVGQIHAVQANLRYPDLVAAAMRDADIAVNLVGLLFERGNQRFDAVMAAGAETVARAASVAGAPLIHISAIGADANSPSHYARAKAAGEQLVMAAQSDSVICGRRSCSGPRTISSTALRRWRGWSRRCRWSAAAIPACSRCSPATSAKRSRALADTVVGEDFKSGKIYELGGPDARTFKELMQFVLATIGRRRLLIPVPFALMKLQAMVLQFLPKPPITPDQVEMLKHDNVVSDDAKRDGRTLEGLGITPETMAAIVPDYLWRFRKTGQFNPHAA